MPDSFGQKPDDYPYGPNDPVTPDHDAPRKADYEYQPAQRRPPSQWGEPDDHMRFAQNYPGIPPGPYWPQVHQIPKILGQNLALNNMIGSVPGQRNSIATMTSLVAYLKAQKEENDPRHKLDELTYNLRKQAAEIDAESRDYHEAMAAADPKNKRQLHEYLWNAAYKHNDQNVLAKLGEGRYEEVEKLIAERDRQSQEYQRSLSSIDAHREHVEREEKRDEDRKKKEDEQSNRLKPYQEDDSKEGNAPKLQNFGSTRLGEEGDQPAAPGKAAAPADTAASPAPQGGGEGGGEGGGVGLDIPGISGQAETPQRVAAAPAPQQQAPAGPGFQYPRTALATGGTASDAPPMGMRAQPTPDQDSPPDTPPGPMQVAQAAGAPPSVTGAPTQRVMPQFDRDNSRALTDAANGPYHLLGRNGLDSLAQEMALGLPVKITAKSDPEIWPVVVARAQEIRQKLNGIATFDFKGTDAEKSKAAFDEIQKVVPVFAGQLKAYVSGTVPPPSGGRNLPVMGYILALGAKIDPSFNGSTFATRAATLKDFTSGQDGRNLVAIATAYAHLHAVQEDLKNLPGPIASMIGQYRYLGKLAGVSDEDRATIGKLENDINTAASEYERALTGGKPTVSGRNEQMSDLDWRKKDVGVVSANIQAKIDRLRERMGKLRDDFTAGVGRQQPQAMFELFDKYSRSGLSKPGSDDLGEIRAASPGDADALRHLDARPPASVKQSSGDSRGRPQPAAEDNEAIDWARGHPNDPRAKQILQHWGQ